jgi:DNA-binding FadR family transcriptional regulator
LLEHAAVVQAIVTRDGDAAELAMRSHLGSVQAALRSWVDQPTADLDP